MGRYKRAALFKTYRIPRLELFKFGLCVALPIVMVASMHLPIVKTTLTNMVRIFARSNARPPRSHAKAVRLRGENK